MDSADRGTSYENLVPERPRGSFMFPFDAVPCFLAERKTDTHISIYKTCTSLATFAPRPPPSLAI